mmetsp:Transcript_26563/g.73020  ORF Transcript_26563/g.73020 Transcript_26563/m.73020 type:complete len:227 (+) Transcript_26563:470-1150(+)
MVKGGGDKGRKHGRSQTVLNGSQPLVQRQEGTPASTDGSANDGSKDGEGKLGRGNGGRCESGQEGYDITAHRFVKDNAHGLENIGKFQNFSQRGNIGVEQVRNKDRNRVGVNGERDGNGVQENGDQNTATRASHGQVDQLVGGWGVALEFFEHFAAMQKGVSDHAHVFDFVGVHEHKVSKLIVQNPGGGILWDIVHGGRGWLRHFCFSLSEWHGCTFFSLECCSSL